MIADTPTAGTPKKDHKIKRKAPPAAPAGADANGAIEATRSIRLPKPRQWYNAPREFKIEFSSEVCGEYEVPDPEAPKPKKGKQRATKKIHLKLDPEFGKALKSGPNPHSTTVTKITKCAMGYFRVSGQDDAGFFEYLDLLHLHRFQVGHVFTGEPPKCFGPNTLEGCGWHWEAQKPTQELFGYGLVVDYLSGLLDVSDERFAFLVGSETRADLEMKIKAEDIALGHVWLKTLNKKGQPLHIEVKTKTGFASFRGNEQDAEVQRSIAAKFASTNKAIFLGVLVAYPDKSEKPERTPHIVIADPGAPEPLPENEQIDFLLRKYYTLAERYGLWIMLRDILRWLSSLNLPLSAKERDQLERLIRRYGNVRRQRLEPRDVGDRTYQGRTFVELWARVGHQGARTMQREDVEEALNRGDLGEVYFAGADEALMKIIAVQQPADLLRYANEEAVAGTVSFIHRREQLDDKTFTYVVNEIRKQLDRW